MPDDSHNRTGQGATARVSNVDPSAPDDAELVLRARQGEAQAQRLLFERHVSMILNLARHLIFDAAEAEDITQEAFAAAFEGLGGLREPSAFKPWLRRILTYKARSHLRHRRLLERVGLGSKLPDELVSPGSSVSEQVEVTEFLKKLERWPIDERLVWVLRHIEGLTMPEVATELGTSQATAKRRLARAERRLGRLR